MSLPTSCKAAVSNGSGKFTIEQIDLGDLEADELLIKMKAAGRYPPCWHPC